VSDDRQALIDLAAAHAMEVRMLYEALERALSHFVAIGGPQAERAAEEINDVLDQHG
jgi:hypothetical protein